MVIGRTLICMLISIMFAHVHLDVCEAELWIVKGIGYGNLWE